MQTLILTPKEYYTPDDKYSYVAISEHWDRHMDTTSKAFCPFCNRLVLGEGDGFEWEDYVDKPMIQDYDGCEGSCVLLDDTLKPIDYQTAIKVFPNYAIPDDEEYIFFKVEVARITRVIDHNIEDYISKNEQTSEIACQLVELCHHVHHPSISFYDYARKHYPGVDIYRNSQQRTEIEKEHYDKYIAKHRRTLNEFLDLHGIKKDPNVGNSNGWEFHGSWNISLPVDSYNLNNPKVAYPKGVELNHDGVYVYLKYEDSNGIEQQMSMWGD